VNDVKKSFFFFILKQNVRKIYRNILRNNIKYVIKFNIIYRWNSTGAYYLISLLLL